MIMPPKLLRILRWPTLAFGICVLALMLALGTDSGRQVLLDTVSRWTRQPDFFLDMQGLRLGQTWQLKTLRLHDATGPWLILRDIRFSPVTRALFQGQIALDRLEIKEIHIRRLPQSKKATTFPTIPPLRIRNIALPRLDLAPEVLGQAASLSLHGGVTLEKAGATGSLRLTRLDRTGDQIIANGRFLAAEKILNVHVRVQEKPGGLLHAALGTKAGTGIDLEATGEGPLTNWPMCISAQVGSLLSATATLTLRMNKTVDADIRAAVQPKAQWGALTELPSRAITLEGQARWTNPRLHVTNLNLHTATDRLDLNATLDTANNRLEATGTATSTDVSWMLPASVRPGQTTLTGNVTLETTGLHAQGQLTTKNWVVGDVPVPESRAEFSLEQPANGPWQSMMRLAAQTPTMPKGLRSWVLTAKAHNRDKALILDSLHMEAPRLTLTGNALLAEQIRLDTTMQVKPLNGDTVPAGNIRGHFTSSLQGSLDREKKTLNADIEITTSNFHGLPPEMDQLLGANSRMQATLNVSPERLELNGIRLASRTNALGSGALSLKQGLFSGQMNATLPQIQTTMARLENGATVSAEVKGRARDYALTFTVQAPRLTSPAVAATDVNAQGDITGLPARPHINLQAQATVNSEPVNLHVQAEKEDTRLHVRHALLTCPQNRLRGTGVMALENRVFVGQTNLKSHDLRPLGHILALDLSGQATAEARFSERSGQQVSLSGQGTNLDFAGLTMAQATMNATLATPGISLETQAHLDCSTVSFAGLHADRITAQTHGQPQALTFQLGLRHRASDTQLSTTGRIQSTPTRLSVQELQGKLTGQKVHLATPVEITLAEKNTTWTPVQLNFGQARLEAVGEISPTHAEANATITHLELASLQPFFPSIPKGQATARLTISGTAQNPDAHLNIQAEKLKLTTDAGDLPELKAAANIRLTAHHVDVQASVNASQKIHLDAHILCPVQASLFAISFPNHLPLQGEIQGQTELFFLPEILRLGSQTMNGTCFTDLRLAGTWEKPSLSGWAQIKNGRYEHFSSGTRLENLDVQVRAQGARLDILVQATDGDQGVGRGHGELDLSAWSYNGDANLENFHFLRTDLVQSTATGSLHLRGAKAILDLGGNLTLSPTDIRLPASPPPDLPDIRIREINSARDRQATTQAETALRLNLDLNILLPDRLSVQGRGLNSDWSGKLHLAGTQADPKISGEMRLTRGTFDLLDRAFTLTKGKLTLSGENPPNPYLDIVGESQVGDTQVQVSLRGPARDFRLSLSSTPALPTDEILALVLFGRSLRQISPIQAVRLAQAAAELTGIGTTPNFLGSLKNSLGLQELDVGTDAVGVGTYLGGKYYVRTQSSVAGPGGTKVEVDVSPKVSVETEIGSGSHQGGGVFWKHDY